MDTPSRRPVGNLTLGSPSVSTASVRAGTRARRPYTRITLTLLCLGAALTGALGTWSARAVAAGTTYYVAPGGSDGNDCLSSGTPCLTINVALAKTAAGDSVSVAAGTYHERLALTHDLTLTGAGASATVIDGSGTVTGTLLSVDPSVVAVVSGLTVQHGHAGEGDGGGVTTGGALTLADSVVRDNAGGPAGGIYQYGGSVTLTRGIVDGNSGDAGGIAASYGTLAVVSSTVAGNSGGAGGIAVDNAALALTGSTVSGNDGTGVQNSGAATLVNSTVSANIGIGLDNLASAALYNSTVGGNSGAGLFSEGNTPVMLANTIVGDNIGPDCSGPLTSQGYNLLGSGAGCTGLYEGVKGDRVDVDPRLGPLQDNGGLTATQAPAPGSPAIDGGNPSGCADDNGRSLTVDQRGWTRPDGVNNRCDSGAFEVQDPPAGMATPVPVATPPAATPAAWPSVAATTTVTRPVPAPATVTPAPARPSATPARPPAPPLTLYPGGRTVTSGDTLAVHLVTSAHAHVRVTLQATASKVVVSGSGKSRRRATRQVVLYRATLDGTADARGRYSGRLRVVYRPVKPTPALLAATTRTAHGAATRTAAVTIEPPRPPRTGHRARPTETWP